MPSLGNKVRIDENDHADDGLHIVRDSGAGNDPPADDAECSNGERRDVLCFSGARIYVK